jgi:hypothetical protein
LCKALALAAVEYGSGGWDNLTLPVATVLLNVVWM